ncbi:MAG: ATP-dependent sacrificial sulfur transferase LarE [bacterium]
MIDSDTAAEKVHRLHSLLKSMESILIAFSGGVDSTYLIAVSKEILGDDVLAVTARSETYPTREYEQAKSIAERLKVKQLTISTKELEYPNFASNPTNRCYFCKKELFTKLKEIGEKHLFKNIADGSNADDVHDFRPGMQALKELGIRSPLKEAGLTKEEIRLLSRQMGLPTWNKPAYACLSSRFPYGMQIDADKLRMVGDAENILFDLGFRQVRVRHHDTVARIEVYSEEIDAFISRENRERVVKKFKEIGYRYVTLDLQGYRTGSMNEGLQQQDIGQET